MMRAMPRPKVSRLSSLYWLMLIVAVAIFGIIRWYGETLPAPAPVAVAHPHVTSGASLLQHTLLALTVVILVARLLGRVFGRIQQPAVIGEVVAGIALGPSLLGRVAPHLSSYLLPPEVAPSLALIANVGIILYMFIVGLELDLRALRQLGPATVAISHASITLPFTLGAGLALWLYPSYCTKGVPFTVFALFIGVSMSVTAFPVLARILKDRGIQTSRLGVMALTCAAANDVTAWCLLALVVAVATAAVGSAVLTAVLAVVFIVLMVFVARPYVERLVEKPALRRPPGQSVLAMICVALLLCALTTEAIGIHAIFGAFLLGAIIPPDSAIARDVTHRLEDLVIVLFLPAFFAFSGMRTEIGLVSGAGQWLACGVVVVVASLGKFGGSALAGRITGLSWRDAGALGTLMNTRGLMELIVLNIGLDLGVISPPLFAIFVIMALATTAATTPVLHLITRGDVSLRSVHPAEVVSGT
jgi:Kef-type K+ transport system membrane component KefB